MSDAPDASGAPDTSAGSESTDATPAHCGAVPQAPAAPALDLLVVGGGINGVGIARDAAGRGLKVLLCEQADLAEGTSSRSSKLIHGGLRYLEHYEFRLVREALAEREVLLGIAPHLVHPLRFVLPHDAELRPAWFVRLGLFVYDHLGHGQSAPLGPDGHLPGTRTLDLRAAPEGQALQPIYRWGFEYSDCQVDDARLVIANAVDARERGAEVCTRTRFVAARPVAGCWAVELQEQRSGRRRTLRARAIVNAAGPWVDRVLDGVQTAVRRGPHGNPQGNPQGGMHSLAAQPDAAAAPRVRLVKGSHIVVRKFWPGPQAYLIQNADGRVVFVIPWGAAAGLGEVDLALVGTTDVPYEGDPGAVAIDAAEIDYLCALVNHSFTCRLGAADVLHSWSGVRPLVDDGSDDPSKLSRDYRFELSGGVGPDPAQPPLLSVYGGKITTYRRLAEQALLRLAPFFPGLPGPWTAAVPLPGGDLPGGDFAGALAQWRARHPWVPAATAERWLRAYGSRVDRMLGAAGSWAGSWVDSWAGLGRDFGAGLTERELRWLRQEEWAETADDVLWRRTHCGLQMNAAQREAVADWLGTASPDR